MNTGTKNEEYRKGYDMLIKRGKTPKEINKLQDYMVESVYETEEFIQGREKWDYTPYLLTESGEMFLGKPIMKYMGESDIDAIRREYNQSYEEYVEDSRREAISYGELEEDILNTVISV